MPNSGEGNSNEGADSVVQAIFQKNRTESADFEVALNALLATGVFATVSGDANYRVFLLSCAGLLLTLTVIRRMAITGRFAREKPIISRSQPFIEFLSFISLFQILHHIINFSILFIPSPIDSLIPASIIIIILFFIFVVVQQLIFRDYFLFWGAYFFSYSMAFEEASKEADDFHNAITSVVASNAFVRVAYMALKDNIPDYDSKEVNELQRFVNDMEEEEEFENGSSMMGLWLAGLVLLAVLFGPVIGILVYFYGEIVEVIFLLLAFSCLNHIIRFLYLGYGIPLRNEPRGIKWQVLGTLVYAIVILSVFS